MTKFVLNMTGFFRNIAVFVFENTIENNVKKIFESINENIVKNIIENTCKDIFESVVENVLESIVFGNTVENPHLAQNSRITRFL